MTEPDEDFATMFEASIKAKRFKRGQTIEGAIVAIGPEVAFVNVGGKGEALLALAHFAHLAQALQLHGVQRLFTLCGGHISPILVAAQNLGLRVIDTRHEANAVFAADAVARVAAQDEIIHLTDNAAIQKWIGDDAAYLADSHVLAFAARHQGGRVAVVDVDGQVLGEAEIVRVRGGGLLMNESMKASSMGPCNPWRFTNWLSAPTCAGSQRDPRF